MTTEILQATMQYGGIGLATFTLWILYKTIGNHLNHNTDALTRLEVAITKLNQFLEDRIK